MSLWSIPRVAYIAPLCLVAYTATVLMSLRTVPLCLMTLLLMSLPLVLISLCVCNAITRMCCNAGCKPLSVVFLYTACVVVLITLCRVSAL